MLRLTEPQPETEFDFANLEAHELANLLPLIDDVNFANLKADIEKNGVLEPILIFEGRILDGRNRYRAAKAVGRLTPAKFKTVCRQNISDSLRLNLRDDLAHLV